MPGSETFNFSAFDDMSIEELENIILLYQNSPEDSGIDEAVILYVMEVLANKININEKAVDVDAAWGSFERDYLPYVEEVLEEEKKTAQTTVAMPNGKRHLHGFYRKAVAVAAVLAFMFVGSAVCYALGYDVFGAISTWTKETFNFYSHSQTQEITADMLSDIENIFDLKDLLEEYGVTERLIPTYIPEGYEQLEIDLGDIGGGNWSYTDIYRRENDSNDLYISVVTVYDGGYEKDPDDPEIYVVNGIEHFIMTNMDDYRATWIDGNFRVCISGLGSREELIKMINSVYGVRQS